MHRCSMCGSISFRTYRDYEYHIRTAHGLKVKLIPENLTGRTVSQIVSDAENSWLLPHLIVNTPKEIVLTTNNGEEHLPACTCRTCINIRLDAIIASSEKSLESLQNSVILEHD